jgi:hypothetical protein
VETAKTRSPWPFIVEGKALGLQHSLQARPGESREVPPVAFNSPSGFVT